jgi:hypothetical protein
MCQNSWKKGNKGKIITVFETKKKIKTIYNDKNILKKEKLGLKWKDG